MTLSSATLNGWLSTATSWVSLVLKFGLLLMVAAVAGARGFGLDLPYVSTLDPVTLAYVCGAFYLVTR